MKRIDEKDKVICVFEEKMDTIACMKLEDELAQALNDCKAGNFPVVFDLAGVDYIASSFLRFCGKASHQLGVKNVTIVNVTPQVKKVFKIAGFADYLSII